MVESIRVLLVEDCATDIELAQQEIKKALPRCIFQQVETKTAYLAQLACFQPHLIISDYQLPHCNGLMAVNLAKIHAPFSPVIILTGAVNEETAAECMKVGASDYVFKEEIKSLGHAVLRALEQRCQREEQRQAQAALYANEQRFQALIEHSSDVVAMLDAEGVILYESPAVRHMLGYAPEELLGKNAFEFLHPDEYATYTTLFQEMLDHPYQPVRKEIRYRHHNGMWCWVEATGTNLLDEPAVEAIVVTYRELTERYQAAAEQAKLEAQLRQSQRMESMGRLAGGVIHDFNNLLTVIAGYTNIAQSRVQESDPIDNLLRQIQQATERATALTHQLLTFGRKQVLAPTILDLNDLTLNLYKMLERLIGEDITLSTQLEPSLWTITADAGQIEQVIINLVVNARDAMPSGGSLRIETHNRQVESAHLDNFPGLHLVPGPYVCIIVADTGHGMNASVKAHLFEPFFTTKEPGKGTGLGLATAYDIIKQRGGDVSVESEVGQGARFTIYLPANLTAMARIQERLVQTKRYRGHETILLVEDETMVRDLVSTILTEGGYTVLKTKDGNDTMTLVQEYTGRIDLLLTDVVMPQISGPALVKQLHGLYPALKVLFMSGYADETIAQHGLHTTQVEFIAKPFSPTALIAKVSEMLNTPTIE